MPESLKDVCRLCLSKDGLMIPIFHSENTNDGTAFRVKIMSCADIQIFADDGLPTKVCHVCVHQVEKSFQFKTMCKNSDAALRSKLQADKLEDSTLLKTEESDHKNGWIDHSGELTSTNNSMPYYVNANSDFLLDKKLYFQVPSCSACSAILDSYEQLVEHLFNVHPDVTPVVCNTCEMSFLTLNSFKEHINDKHNFSCNKCDQVFQHPKNLEDHIKTHLEAILSCRFCKETFSKMSEKKKHELQHLELACRFCSITFPTKELCNAHATSCTQTYHCMFCESTFQLKKDLIQHVNSCHDESSVPKCKNCYKVFNDWEEIPRHSCENQNQKNLQCKFCQISFTSSSFLESHISSEHGEDNGDNDEPLKCKFCTKSFSLKSSLRRHEKSHSGLKPYQCKFCPRKFKDNSTCIVHMRTHTGEHPFRCQECNKDFKQLANLKMHTYRHHKKNKVTETIPEVVAESNPEYGQLYQSPVLENYTIEATRVYQHLDLCVPNNFEHGVDIS